MNIILEKWLIQSIDLMSSAWPCWPAMATPYIFVWQMISHCHIVPTTHIRCSCGILPSTTINSALVELYAFIFVFQKHIISCDMMHTITSHYYYWVTTSVTEDLRTHFFIWLIFFRWHIGIGALHKILVFNQFILSSFIMIMKTMQILFQSFKYSSQPWLSSFKSWSIKFESFCLIGMIANIIIISHN